MRRATYKDSDLQQITDGLDELWITGRRKDIATVISYAAQRLADAFEQRHNIIAMQLSEIIDQEALALSEIPGGD